MKFTKRNIIVFVSYFGKCTVAFIVGGIAIHLFVMFLDYLLMSQPVYVNLHDNFIDSALSVPMFPMMVAYGILSLAMFIMWLKKKKAVLLMHEKEIHSERAKAVLKVMQRITGMLAEHIAVHNAEIMGWVEFRKRRGNSVSVKVEQSSRNIANALSSLSEISFVAPYTKSRPENIDDFERLLKSQLFKKPPSGRKTYPLYPNKCHPYS